MVVLHLFRTGAVHLFTCSYHTSIYVLSSLHVSITNEERVELSREESHTDGDGSAMMTRLTREGLGRACFHDRLCPSGSRPSAHHCRCHFRRCPACPPLPRPTLAHNRRPSFRATCMLSEADRRAAKKELQYGNNARVRVPRRPARTCVTLTD